MRAQRTNRSATRRRGVVLILILAMLGLLALIGVTFATFSNQARMSGVAIAQAAARTGADEVFDFALEQLINDSNNPKSAIRGHSLLRDMYGRDFYTDFIDNRLKVYQNHYLHQLPEPSGQPLAITGVTQAPTVMNPQLAYVVTTNIPTDNNGQAIQQLPSLYGANFTGNVLRLQQWVLDATNSRYTPVRQIQRADRLTQTFEIVADNRSGNFHVFTLSFADRLTSATELDPSISAFVQPDSPTPAGYSVPMGATVANIFEIDGRYMRAFNGIGLGTSVAMDDIGVARPFSAYGNFLYNRLNGANYPSGVNDPNLPASSMSSLPAQLDEDYDAADNENWFLALRSADGQVLIPSFHRPGNIIYNPNDQTENDWKSGTLSSRSKFLRPRQIDNPLSGDTFRDIIPDANGRISKYDVDNDGDGAPDSVWVDLGFPVRTDASGKKYKPLFAFMVTGSNGRLPLNTAGNLSSRAPDGFPTLNHTSHLGYTPNEVNPKYALTPTYPVFNEAYLTDNTLPQYRPAVAPADGLINLQLMTQGNPGRLSAAIPATDGRWGEVGILNATGYTSFPRAGRSYMPNAPGMASDMFDSDYNGYDFAPGGGPETQDMLDAAGRTLLPVERLRRFVTPVDISGNGRMMAYDSYPMNPLDYGTGFDAQGRVGYHLYYRPPGISNWAVDHVDFSDITTNTLNKLHGYESHRNPDANNRGIMAMMPWDNPNNDPAVNGLKVPTFSGTINSAPQNLPPSPAVTGNLPGGSMALTDPSQMNLYEKSAVDAPFDLIDQEWLERMGDIDSPNLSSRLSTLLDASNLQDFQPTPIQAASYATYRNLLTTDDAAAKKRKLFTTESWDLGVAAVPINFNANGAYFGRANVATTLSDGSTPLLFTNVASNPALVHGGRRFNVNLPLPPSNLSTEPVRQKYVRELYQLLKSVWAPPDGASLTALQLAAIGQYCVNVVDFRDPDATMTYFENYDITYYTPPAISVADTLANSVIVDPNAAPSATFNKNIYLPSSVMKRTDPSTQPAVVQWGMEYNPIAISEMLGYTFTRRDTVANKDVATPRLFVELVNTLTSDYGAAGGGTASNQSLQGWGLVITQDDPTIDPATADPALAPAERPNAATGQLSANAIGHMVYLKSSLDPLGGTLPEPLTLAGGKAVSAITQGGPSPGPHYYTMSNYINGTDPSKPAAGVPPLESKMDNNVAKTPDFSIDTPISDDLINQIPLAQSGTPRTTDSQYYWIHLLRPANPNAGIDAYTAWITTNPTDPAGADKAAKNALKAEPKVVVDSFRFPYFVAVGNIPPPDTNGDVNVTADTNAIYSVKRRQPYRGGHFVPRAEEFNPPTPYGYTEQTFPSTSGVTTGANPVYSLSGNYIAKKGGTLTAQRITGPIFQSFDAPGTGTDNWDHFPFHDRDFQSLAELFLVPACPPGLFTKLFVENNNAVKYTTAAGWATADIGPSPADAPTTKYYYKPPFVATNPPSSGTYSSAADWGGTVRGVRSIQDPGAFPYMAEAFFYSSGAQNGWFRFLEFLEVPSNSLGYIGPVAAGQNADWARRDLRPGLINLNLITDEEVFFGLLDDLRVNAVNINPGAANYVQPGVTATAPVGVQGAPHMVTSIYATGLPSFSAPINSPGFFNGGGIGMKAAFSDFLKLRDGGSGVVYSPFSAASPIWGDTNPANRIAMPSKPFRSLATLDINDTVLRPARLAAFQALNNPPIPAQMIPGYTDMGIYHGLVTPRVPPRRLFEVPDGDPNIVFGATGRDNLASETNTHPRNLPNDQGGPVLPWPDPTAATAAPDHVFLANPNASLFIDTTDTTDPMVAPNHGYLGASTHVSAGPMDPMPAKTDHRWHPAFRYEMLSKVMNNTTVRTHQFSVWITVGFFEVTHEGNPQMADVRDANGLSLGVDQLGTEIGAAEGKAVRYRSFFLVDRTRATGFDPFAPGDFRDLVKFRRRIE